MTVQNAKELPVSELLPSYKTVCGTVSDPFDCNYGNTGVSILSTGRCEFEAYLEALKDADATLITENAIADNRFLTYLVKGADGTEYAVYLMFYPLYCNVRIVWGERAFLPSEAVVPASNGTRTSVIQPARDGVFSGNRGETVNGAPGMSYVIVLADGSFILIDGGPRVAKVTTKHYENGAWIDDEPKDCRDCDTLYELLRTRTPEGQKPVVAAWFFSHAHSDHVHLACDFLAKYKDDVEVRVGALNFPDFTKHPTDHEPNDHLQNCAETTKNRLIEAGASLWVIHSGEKMAFPGCEAEILATPEDYYPSHFSWGNHSSSAFRFTFAGKTFIALGDCEKDICQRMADQFGTELKSDILQVSHHGANGACSALYKVIDPDYCFWPIDVYRFTTDERTRGAKRRYEFNAWLRNDEVRVRKHYHNTDEAEIFTDEK